MKTVKVSVAIELAICALAAGLLGTLGTGEAAKGPRPAPQSPAIIDDARHSNANLVDMHVTNVGSFSWHLGSQRPGLTYPRGTNKQAVFASGIWIGARVGGQRRTVVAEYSQEYTPGPVIGGSYAPDWENNPNYRVFKVVRYTGDPEDTMRVNVDPPPSSAYDESVVHHSWGEYMRGAAPYGAPVRTHRLPDPDSPGDSIDVVGPDVQGDQMLWSVYNDFRQERHTNNAGASPPLGLEIQQTTFSFDRQDALAHVIFLKFLMINKGTNTLEDTYVSVWSDPDLGSASDDLVGSDTTLSLGYTYNATNSDGVYGSAPPAVGFDFFQGPIVPSPGDTAFVSGVPKPDYRNLPMTSFNKYINGTDPSSTDQTYNYMLGLDRDGTPVVDPTTSDTTTFAVPGDPVTGTGWLDSNPADRRLMLTSGPFRMAPGDTQEVVTAVIMGQGRDRLTSLTALKYNDRFAQDAFNLNFQLPNPPPAPRVRVSEMSNEITLSWDDRSETQYNEPGYAFEGYNVYQGASVAGPWTLVATYDRANDQGIIFDEVFDSEAGVVINRPVQFGSDSGLRRYIVLNQDYVRGGPLNNATEYYFAVTSYSFGPEKTPKTLENSPASQVITVVPQGPPAGTRLTGGAVLDTIPGDHVSGISDGSVAAVVVDPRSVTGDVYEVTFGEMPVVGEEGDTTLVPVWNLTNTTTGTVVLANQQNQTGDENYFVADGILWRVLGPPAGFKTNGKGNPMIDEVAGPGGTPVPPDDNGGPGNDVWHSLGSTGEWILSAGGGDGGVGRLTRDGDDNANVTGDIVMRWDDDPGNIGWWVFDDDVVVGPVPFGLYLRDPDSGEESRLIAAMFSGENTPGVYDYPAEAGINDDAFSGFPATDWAYAYTFTGTYEDFLADAADGTVDNDPTQNELFARLIVASEERIMPAEGTEIVFSATKPNTPADVFRVTTTAPTVAPETARADLSKVLAVPNPYFNRSTYELNQFDRRVKFTNLPRRCTIRIFNLAGDLVRTLPEKNNESSIAEWDLLTDNGIPVASGIYVWHVDAPGVGQKFGRMAVFVEKERLNTF